MPGPNITQAEFERAVEAGRLWLAETDSGYVSAGRVGSDVAVINAIERAYDGGWSAWLELSVRAANDV